MTSITAGLTLVVILVNVLQIFEPCKAEQLRKLNDTKELAEALDQLMGHPRASLHYRYPTGWVTTGVYDSAVPQGRDDRHLLYGCQDIGVGDYLKQVNTSGTCIRIFHEKECTGISTAIYPDELLLETKIRTYTAPPPSSPRDEFTEASVGPCLENEFESASFFRSSRGELVVEKDVTGPRYIPDRIFKTGALEVEEFDSMFTTEALYVCDDFSSSFPPNESYPFSGCIKSLTVRGRVEKIQVYLNPSKLRPAASPESTPPPPASILKAWDSMEKQEKDVMGFILPPSLSEFAYEAFNVFPTSRESRDKWEGILEKITKYLKSQPDHSTKMPEVLMAIRFYYNRNSAKARPCGFYYNFDFSSGFDAKFLRSTVYGFHWN